MLLVCYTNHFNHRICRVLEEPLTPLSPPRVLRLQYTCNCIQFVGSHMFTFTFSDAVIRSREAQTSEKRACAPIVEQGKLFSLEEKT